MHITNEMNMHNCQLCRKNGLEDVSERNMGKMYLLIMSHVSVTILAVQKRD